MLVTKELMPVPFLLRAATEEEELDFRFSSPLPRRFQFLLLLLLSAWEMCLFRSTVRSPPRARGQGEARAKIVVVAAVRVER